MKKGLCLTAGQNQDVVIRSVFVKVKSKIKFSCIIFVISTGPQVDNAAAAADVTTLSSAGCTFFVLHFLGKLFDHVEQN